VAALESYRLSTLDNGLRVVTERLPGMRSMSLGVWINSGSRGEPGGVSGISHFIEHLLFKGTQSYSAFDIARNFDEMGAEPNASTSKEHTLVHARFLADNLEVAYGVIADMVARPTLADIDSEREVVLEEVAMYEDSPPELIHDYLTASVFYAHPLGNPVIGHTATLRDIDAAAVQSYHRAHYVNGSMVIAAAGNVDHDLLCQLTHKYFGGGDGAAPQVALWAPEPRHVAGFSEKDTEQYHVCLGGPGPRHGDPDRYAVFLLDTLLGGAWSSRLFQEVRDKRGLAYSVYSYTTLYADTGLSAVYFGSREEAVEEAMTLILNELRSVVAQVPEEDLERARHHLKGALVLSMESPSSRMQSLGRSILTGIPVLTLDELLAAIDAVSLADVAAAAAHYYDVAKWSAVCIGPRPEPFRAVAGDFTWEES